MVFTFVMRVRRLATCAAAGCMLLPAIAFAQGPSPVAPMDLTRPRFDTETPQHDVGSLMTKAPQTVVAEIEGRAITLGQVGDTIRELPLAIRQRPFDTLFLQARQDLIQRQALVIKAHQTGLDDDPAIKRRVQEQVDRVLAEAYLLQQIDARITEEMLLKKYDEIVRGKPGADQVRFRLILVGTEREALEIIKELQSGADFATLARRASKDPTSAIGGEVAFVGRDGLTPEIGAVAFALAPGQLAPFPVGAAGAWYIVKVEERQRAETPPFQAVREVLRHYLQRETAPAVLKAALDQLTVREYTITGKDAAANQN